MATWRKTAARPWRFVALGVVVLCGAGVLPGSAAGQGSGGGGAVLDSASSFWRVYYVMSAPVIRNGKETKKLRTLFEETPAPPQEWTKAEFDDSPWTRVAGKPLIPKVSRDSRSKEPGESFSAETEGSSPALGLICMRGRFGVGDPAGASLRLSLRYRGGVIVYVNGTEVGRANMAKDASGPDALADDYDQAALKGARVRSAEVAIPSKALRRGGNVLAVEVHRAPYPAEANDWITNRGGSFKAYRFIWASCGLDGLALVSGSPGAVTANVARPRGFQVWNSSPMQPDMDLDYGDPFEPLRPIKLVGTRNGVCSGKVVVGNDQPIRGLKGVITDLSAGQGKIPASAVQVRYAIPTAEEPVLEDHYSAQADLLDGLSEKPLAVVEVRKKKGTWSFGAVCPVWVTVAIPDKASPGDYKGKLTITAEGMKSVEVPVELKVSGWQMPPPSEFRTVVDILQSPETVAIQYDVPLWSDKHFKLLEKSLERAGYVGSWTLHIPLICQSNIGNEQSVVRWVKKAGGTYKYDFTVLDKYLDLAEKHMGKPRAVDLVVWDLYLGFQGLDQTPSFLEHNTNLGKNFKPMDIQVSMLDEGTRKVTTGTVGRYDEKGKANWKALVDQLMERLEKRGLDKTLHIGHSYDLPPSDEFVKFWDELLPGVHYMRYGHYDYRTFGKTPQGVSDFIVFECAFGWGLKPMYGWKNPLVELPWIRLRSEHSVTGTYWKPDPYVTIPLVVFRVLPEQCIQSHFRGFGRMGLDYWPVLPNDKGQKNMLGIQGRYPISSWRQSDEMILCIVPPGPDGALSSSKLEMLREGMQDAEARIFLESVLSDPARRGKLSGELAVKAQAVLDARVRALQMNVSRPPIAGFETEAQPDLTGISFGGMYAVRHSAIFQQWFMESGWQQRSGDLFDVAGEVAEAGGQ